MDVVTLGEFTLGRGVYDPAGWANDVKPIAGTDSCRVHDRHRAFRADDDPFRRRHNSSRPWGGIRSRPGHDGWTVGEEPCVMIDSGIAAYTKPA